LIKKKIPLISNHPFPIWSNSEKCELDERWPKPSRRNNSRKNFKPKKKFSENSRWKKGKWNFDKKYSK
jgi:hypothetical protein